MSEIVMHVAAMTGAGWLFLGALCMLAAGFLVVDRQPKKKARMEDSAQPGERRAA